MNILETIKKALKHYKYVVVEADSNCIVVTAIANDTDFPLITSDGEQWALSDFHNQIIATLLPIGE